MFGASRFNHLYDHESTEGSERYPAALTLIPDQQQSYTDPYDNLDWRRPSTHRGEIASDSLHRCRK